MSLVGLKEHLFAYQGYTDRAQSDLLAENIIKELMEHARTLPMPYYADPDYWDGALAMKAFLKKYMRGET